MGAGTTVESTRTAPALNRAETKGQSSSRDRSCPAPHASSSSHFTSENVAESITLPLPPRNWLQPVPVHHSSIMARLAESPAPPNGTQSVKKPQSTKNGAFNTFLSSPGKPSGSQSPHPNKRIKSLAPTGTPRSDASRSRSPPSQNPSPRLPVSPSPRKALSDTADDVDTADRSTPADTVTAAAPAENDTSEPTSSTAPVTAMEATPDAEASGSTPEPSAPRTGVVSSVRKTFSNVVNNITGQRTGTTTVTTTFEQTIVSRKRSREPNVEESPAPADKEADQEIEAANGTEGNTTIQLGNQFEAEVEAEEIRAKSPVKEAVQAEDAEINVATSIDNADTVEAAPTENSATNAAGDEDVEMDDPKNGMFVFDKILGHRRDPNDKTLFQMHINWKHDDPTWETEQTIHEDAEEALFAYWNSLKGGRLGAMADKNLWHALRVEKHKQKPSGAVQLYVCWIGSPERSWEPESQVEVYARQHVENYWKSKGGREKCIKAVAMPVKKGRGRPRKNNAAEPDVEVEVLKEASREPKPRGRPGRKQKRDDTAAEESQPEKSEEASAAEDKPEPAAKEQSEADEEPPKKRARGRPRKVNA
ncbi:chromo domain-containing protein [Colletotrichum costaricense]|uniref:Chromo domain-containing protein n=1 Tax=Colletotrichum costaricense TaxID=1209916 RepID=A0AAJ0DWF9_9PEZI|nr:chromo domain-containing protein [Colletotrichum costaricense]KAK1516921.1 chromo domain-containing protein [Colletotrichum costaricense]